MVVLRGNRVECATCGARGELIAAGGEVAVRFSAEGCRASVISLHEKRAHFHEIQATAARQHELRGEIEARASAYDGFDRHTRPT